jgi:hypothetical protein
VQFTLKVAILEYSFAKHSQEILGVKFPGLVEMSGYMLILFFFAPSTNNFSVFGLHDGDWLLFSYLSK